MKTDKVSAIILAAGRGKRMNSSIPKQYMELLGKPMLYYSIKAFEKSIVDEIILVVSQGEEDFCKKEIVDKYKFKKVSRIVSGGDERYLSVFNGLQVLTKSDYVLIHDGARPLISIESIKQMVEEVKMHSACVLGVPVKDTVKIVNNLGQVVSTPDRRLVYKIQTPQAFSYTLIYNAYQEIMKQEEILVTDDAMVVETCANVVIKIVEGSYHNIKVTTSEDIRFVELLLGESSN